MFNILCQFVPVYMYVSYKSDSSFLSSLLHHDHFLVFYQTPPSHNKMHQQAWPAVILLILIRIFFGKLWNGILDCHPALDLSRAEFG